MVHDIGHDGFNNAFHKVGPATAAARGSRSAG
jgi:hypothetical protein